jgi:hypothetical protein
MANPVSFSIVAGMSIPWLRSCLLVSCGRPSSSVLIADRTTFFVLNLTARSAN